jgi:hypothetical protein
MKFTLMIQYLGTYDSIVTDLIKALPGNSSINTVQHATIEEGCVFRVHGDIMQRWVVVT